MDARALKGQCGVGSRRHGDDLQKKSGRSLRVDNAGLQPESWSLFKAVRGHGLRGHYSPDRLEREPGVLPLIQRGKSGVPAFTRYSCLRLYRRRLVRKLTLHVQVL